MLSARCFWSVDRQRGFKMPGPPPREHAAPHTQTKKPALPPAFYLLSIRQSLALKTSRLERGFQRGLFGLCDRALDRGLHLLEGADLDLADALARHAELGSKVFQRHRLIGEAARLEDAAFARVEHAHGAVQGVTAGVILPLLGPHCFPVWGNVG